MKHVVMSVMNLMRTVIQTVQYRKLILKKLNRMKKSNQKLYKIVIWMMNVKCLMTNSSIRWKHLSFRSSLKISNQQ